eukprot:TRINITY_DN64079_c1_g1_i2.p1 TRINITY_DN64079_c1_g1~~TRINITY_DN64079_c1_g1_i2.p1  ORF type:complete len:459 (-),score=37.84 TRINITY_DN64079_c1_g1_i2:1050-2426(-)
MMFTLPSRTPVPTAMLCLMLLVVGCFADNMTIHHPIQLNMKTWQHSSTQTEYYTFNLTNPWAVAFNGAKPILQEVGPYVYSNILQKGNITWRGDTVRYTYKESWKFNRDATPAHLDPNKDMISIPNIAFNSLVYGYETNTLGPLSVFKGLIPVWYNYWKHTLCSPFVNFTVEQVLFGYEDPLLVRICKDTGQHCNTTHVYLQQNNSPVTWNHTTVQKSGASSVYEATRLVEWGGHKSYAWWAGAAQHKLGGSDGLLFRPYWRINDTMSVFNGVVFRPLDFIYGKSISYAGGKLEGWRWVPDPKDFQNATENPANAQYYQYGKAGVLNITSTASGVFGFPLSSPLFESYPYFYLSDPWYAKQVELKLVNPNWKPQEVLTWLDMQPKIGYPLDHQLSIQLSIPMYVNSTAFKGWNQRSGIYFPVFWGKDTRKVTSEETTTVMQEVEKCNGRPPPRPPALH